MFKYTVNSNFHLIRSKTLPTNDFELTVPDLYWHLGKFVTPPPYKDVCRKTIANQHHVSIVGVDYYSSVCNVHFKSVSSTE